ncbi:MAG TPA: VOC family protein [Candidatus Binatia bacterium]|nr:VOC family protein [Candidatus Binatia bacterium]
MRIIAIDHVQLAMPAGREDDARRFYSDLLGLPERPKPPQLAKRSGAWFESDSVKIHVGVEADFRPARKAHPALLVRGLAELVDRLRAAGFDVVEDAPTGAPQTYVSDPFGNRLELIDAESETP